MSDRWPEGWTRREDGHVGRGRDGFARAEHRQPAYGRDTYDDPYDPYADPHPGDQLAGHGRDDGGRYGPPPRRRRRRRWPRVLAGLTVVLLVVAVGGYLYLDSRLKREAVLEDYPGRIADTPGTNWLIVGSDSREGLSKDEQRKLKTGFTGGRRTDSMMLLHYGSGGTSLISLPRDSYVPIPGRGSNKLNAAFAFGGPKLLVRTVEKATGVHIDHYAEIGFNGFVGVVDAVGGVDICVKKDITDPKAGLDLKAGCQTLDGGQALGYVRTRAFLRADLERVEHQRQFFAALMKKASSPGTMLNPFRSVPLAMNATSNFLVDDGDHLHHLVRMMWAMKGVSGNDGVTTTVPIGGGGNSPSAGAYITWDRSKANRLFEALQQDQPIPRDVITR
ncbi:LytR family transcriptional regulator [Actinomadura spongiicola]|uniref:LytR family transcriptional regulator n=1 Tax=Actinomadura spongiicola TaxID=2303421 RepID=A0A372GCF3_9ACTN|nr:LCP family protein [Actinomadura spongiicola]RFS82753.1 LytR family transcriptional regulator [Actinomadura spongiicola]